MKPITALILSLTLALLSISAPAASDTSFEPNGWMSTHFVDHPLVGSVWRGDGQQSNWQAFSQRVSQAHYVMIGETHTNIDHHRLQANIVLALSRLGRQPSVVWEMIPSDKQAVLDSPDLRLPNAIDALGKQLNWESNGWPSWSMYSPIALNAVANRLPMRGAGLSRLFLRKLARSGGTDLNPRQRKRLHLSDPLSATDRQSMSRELDEGHCGLMGKSAIKSMQVVQRARDGAMAQAMLDRDPVDGAVLIAGNGHVRNDWGVPAILARTRPGSSRISIAQVEVLDTMLKPSSYSVFASGQTLHDFVIFTPRSEIRDYCAELRKRMKR